MGNTTDIGWLNIIIGSVLLVLPIIIFAKYKTGFVRATLIAFLRMSLQLWLVGFYLGYVFRLNSVWINSAWVIIMIIAASITILRRTDLDYKRFLLPVSASVIIGISINTLVFALLIMNWHDFTQSRYIIPITGMIIGNCLNNAIIGLRSFSGGLIKNQDRYKYSLMCGANESEALRPYISNALKDAFNPTIASTATIGLIWLPGMMTGQILGGSSPETAIKYQIMIMISIFVAGVVTTYLSILFSRRFLLGESGIIDQSSLSK